MKKVILGSVTLIIALIFCHKAYSQTDKSSRFAIVIGVKSYQYVTPLQNSLNDARDMSAQLKLKGFKVVECFDPPTKRKMQDAIMTYFDLLQKNENSVGMVFYSGHGMQVDGSNYLVPTEANPKIKADLEDQCLNMDYVMRALEQAGNPLNIFVLDACRNNPFRGFYRSGQEGLNMVNTPKGSYVVYATRPGSVASDGTGRNGLFTSKLLKYMNAEGLNIEQVFKRLAYDVAAESEDKQRPWIASDYMGDFYFTPVKASATPEVKKEAAVVIPAVTTPSNVVGKQETTLSSPPVPVWISPDQTSSSTTSREVTIKVGIHTSHPVKYVDVLVNGARQTLTGVVSSTDPTKFRKFIEQKVTLTPGPNEIKIIAENEDGEMTSESRLISLVEPVSGSAMGPRTDYALVIATNEYDGWDDLSNPVFDATAVADELEHNYGFKVEKVFNRTKAEVMTKIREYARKNYKGDDQLFIFIAGHGQFDEIGKDGYMVCKNSSVSDPTFETHIPFSVLRTTIDNFSAKHILLTMDVCYGGTFDQALATRGDDNSNPAIASLSDLDYVAKHLTYKTRMYMISGGKLYVPDNRPGKHSPFSSKFIAALRTYGGARKVLTAEKIWLMVETTRPEPTYGSFGDHEPGAGFVFQAR